MKVLKNITCYTVIIAAIIYICFKPSEVYSDTIGFREAQKLYNLGILLLEKNISDEQLSSFLEQPSTKNTAYLSSLRLTGSDILPGKSLYNDIISVRFFRNDNIDSYKNSLVNLEYITSTSLSQADAYRILLSILGYTTDNYGTKDQDVLLFAENIGFGFKQTVSAKSSLSNGEFANILFESLYVCGQNTKMPVIHTLATIDQNFLVKAKKLKLIDTFPNILPLFTHGAFVEGSFKELIGNEIQSTVQKHEWSAQYLLVTPEEYETYKATLQKAGWTLEVEYLRENGNINEKCALLYKSFEGYEYYSMLVFNETSKTIDLWLAF